MRPSTEIAGIITQKKAQYCRFLDTHQWHLFDQILLPDVTFTALDEGVVMQLEGKDFRLNDRKSWVAHFRSSFTDMKTFHMIGPAELDQISDNEVKAVFPMQYLTGPKGLGSQEHSTGGGHYFETYKRVEDDWFLADIRIDICYRFVTGQVGSVSH